MDATEIDVLSAGNPSRAVFPRAVNPTLRLLPLVHPARPTAGLGAVTTDAVSLTSPRLPARLRLSARATASGSSSSTTASLARLPRRLLLPSRRPLPSRRSPLLPLHHRSLQLPPSLLPPLRRPRAATVVAETSCMYLLSMSRTMLTVYVICSWEPKSCCLPQGGQPNPPAPPSGTSCPTNGWSWSNDQGGRLGLLYMGYTVPLLQRIGCLDPKRARLRLS